jgi:hypothetical protein
MLGAAIVMVDLQQGVFMNWFEQHSGKSSRITFWSLASQ